jgi:segregation and condensation protein A
LEPACQVKLEAFEGPLDLLLHLIYKNRLKITDIPIATVTAQYLEYIDFMQAGLDIVVAGEYLVMAATLMHIKSRMLLPRPDPVDPEEDPRLEIVRPLQELARMREAATELKSRPILGRDVFVRERGLEDERFESFDETSRSEWTFDVSLTDLISAFKEVLGNKALPRVLEITRAKASLSERMESLSKMLDQTEKIRFFELFWGEDREIVIVTFLALLELARLGRVRLLQERSGGDIMILLRRRKDMDNPIAIYI